MQKWTNQEMIEAILKNHPGLTREEVLEHAAEFGFDLTDPPPDDEPAGAR